MNKHFRFILTDDVAVNNLLTRVIIRKTLPGAEIVDFTSALDTLGYIEKNYPCQHDIVTILLLDIYMPHMSGWDFLEQYKQLRGEIKSQITVHLLSSSISAEDHGRANENSLVSGFLLKPLSGEAIKKVLSDRK